MASPTNSRVSRVLPVFQWLCENGGADWAADLLKLTEGMESATACGSVITVEAEKERKVPASPARLAWMIRNVESLVPQNGKKWRTLLRRIQQFSDKERAEALERLDAGNTRGLKKKLKLEGATSADCLIECEDLIIWIEGKRFDWLSPSIEWDVTRDQLARNVEAAWILAEQAGKDFRVLIAHEAELKHHENALLEGYRKGTWAAGWPHLPVELRDHFSRRIGTVTWGRIAKEWPRLQDLLDLTD